MTWKHGTRYGWVKRGCRCDLCRQARLERDRAARQRRREKFARGEIEIRHGNYGDAKEYGCSCDLCKEANRAYNRQRLGQEPRRVFTDAEIAEGVRLYETVGRRKAAKAMEVSTNTIRRWAKEAGATCYKPPPVHGTVGGYQRGCRCESCVEGYRSTQREMRDNRVAKLSAGRVDVVHGTASTYINWGCRCRACTEANTIKNRPAQARYRERQRAARERRAS